MKNSNLVRQNCHTASMTSVNWLSSFLQCHSTLSVQIPPLTSRNRVANFNRDNVNAFFDLLEKVMDRYRDCSHIYNVDEKGIPTVNYPTKSV